MKTLLCVGTILACAAAANIDRIDRQSDEAMASVVKANAEADAMLESLDRLASGQMTPAERLAWQRELNQKAEAAKSAMQQLRDSTAER